MTRYLLSLLSTTALCMMGITGCAADAGDEPADEEVATSQEALLCNYDLNCIPDSPPGYDTGTGEPSCSECAYIPTKHGYFYVCANGPGVPTTFHPCAP